MKTNFCVITDTHYYDLALGKRLDGQQKTLNESGAVIDAALDKFLAYEDCDVLLIGGDMTCNGERESHEGLIKKLRRVQDAGKRVLLITSTHDYEQQINENKLTWGGQIGVVEIENGEWNPGMTRREDLRGLYDEFGFSDAIAQYDEMSYAAQIAPGLRVLMLNDDGNVDGFTRDKDIFCGLYPEQLDWVREQVKAAEEAGDAIFAVIHHPVMPPFAFYHHFSLHDMHGHHENENIRNALADAGIRLVFTGHTHMHNIAHYTSPAGNAFTDINTAALTGYPAPLRYCTYEDGVLDVHTETIEDFDWDKGGLSAQEYLKEMYDRTPNKVVYGAAHDFEVFVNEANGFSVRRHQIEGHKFLIKCAGLFLERATLGTLGSLLLCRHKLPKAARKVGIVELTTDLIRNVFLGTGNYSKDDPMVKAVFILAERLQKLIGKKLKGTFAENLPELFHTVIFDDGTPDWEAKITLKG